MFNDKLKKSENETFHEELIKIEKEKENECCNMPKQDIPVLINLKKNSEEKIKAQQEFNESLEKLNSSDLTIIKEAIKKCYLVTQYNITITHQNLEFVLLLAFKLGRNATIYDEVLNYASLILLNRPNLGIEIIDSDIFAQYIQLLHTSMKKCELNFLNNFFTSSFEVIRASIAKFNFIEDILNSLNDPSISPMDFINLLSIFTSIANEYPPEDINDISLIFFESIITKFIFHDDSDIFGEVCHLYNMILEECTKNEFFQFLLSIIPTQDPNKQLHVSDYLLQRILTVRKQIYREYILNIFMNFTYQSNYYSKQLYLQGILPKLLSLLNDLTDENISVKILQTAQNFFALGYEVALEIASSNFTNVAIRLLDFGGFSAKEAAIKYFCGLCNFSKDQNIQHFLIENNIISQLMEFIDIPNPKIWDFIFVALYKNAEAAYATGTNFTQLFEHPLFQSIDVNEFYQSLCTILQTIEEFNSTKQKDYKQLHSNVLYFLDQMELILFEDS